MKDTGEALCNYAGPRQPWHDIHCQVQGPVVWDLLTNYVQRWKRQAGNLHQQDLLNLTRVSAKAASSTTYREVSKRGIQMHA